MKSVLRWLLSPVVIGTLGLLVLSALVWWAFPLVAFGSVRPFDGFWVRVLLLALLWALWLGWLGWGLLRRKRTHAALVKGLSAGNAAGQREAEVLARRFDEAMAKLRATSGRSLLRPGSYLYELPWYMFIGAPGAGKTTALMNSGLQFLLGDGKSGASVTGVGGTRNCDWWFTRDAVLIDTAGRYSTQDSDAAADAGAWDAFLALLKKTRPRQPITGVLLTVNAFDLVQQSAADRNELARSLRDRLHELQNKLGVRAPVYVLVTKMDLVAGFNETFGDLPKDAREQVWGFTLPWQDGADPDVEKAFDQGFLGLEQRLGEGLGERLQAERDGSRRAAVFGFPQELAALRRPLREFVGAVFTAGGQVQRTPPLRGFYFTSGTQEGTPIDRVMGALGRSFGLERPALATRGAGPGKSFFLARLLRDVIFVERGLGAFDAKAERRRRLLRTGAMAGIGVLSLGLVAGWAVSFVRNVSYADDVAAKLPAIKQAVDAIPPGTGGDVAVLAPPLQAVKTAAHSEAFALDDPPLTMTLGLYQGDKLDAGAQLAYHRLLEKAFAPRLATRLEERLRAANNSNLENAYEALKNYLMLYTPERFDADTLAAWVGTDWDVQYANTLEPAARAELDAHLDELLARGAPPPIVVRDDALVAQMREMLNALPLELRVYGRIKRSSRGNDLPDFTVAANAGTRAAQVYRRASGEPLTRGIAGLYTREGYRRSFQGTIPQVSAQLAAEETWVMGVRNDPERIKALTLGNALANRVRRAYLEDYVKEWDRYLADVTLVPMTTIAQQIEVFRLLAAVDSPMATFVRRVSEETTLAPPAGASAPATNPVSQLANQAARARAEAAKLADPGAAPTLPGSGPLERIVDDHFAGYRRLITGQPSPMDDLRRLFDEQQAYLLAIDNAQKTRSPPPPGGGAGPKLKLAGGQLPDSLRETMNVLADAGARQSQSAERDVLTAELRPIADFCQRAIANRYPFAAGSRADVMPEDFGQLFGQGGLLDDFFSRRLVALVDTGGATWAYRPLPDGTRPSPGSLPEFQRAARIREAFFRSGGKAPQFRIDVRAAELADGLKEVVIDIDGQAFKLSAGGPPVTLSWPSQRVASRLTLSTSPGAAPQVFEGPWALFRMFERFEIQPSGQPERFGVNMNLEGRRARLEVTSSSVLNPFRLREIQQFRCPGNV
ncbi:type VI secretion system membrane subunit TssM [Pseudorhodoferax sp.]|uniref:type VI secretion system membrane subunit TssM n=1 Tax=Pseudorhodoferax sp. TaxID=1993553 RepID=UPI002DD63FB1|nr:type VI secretion system membrane subunit TssM [Pseudorhodoferax sp.]